MRVVCCGAMRPELAEKSGTGREAGRQSDTASKSTDRKQSAWAGTGTFA